MTELSNERVEEILHKETKKTEELATLLRAIYTRYMRLYEDYFADIDALDDDAIAKFKGYHEETRLLMKYYYMDIPHDICAAIDEFDEKYTSKLLGAEWHKTLYESYDEFFEENSGNDENEKSIKAAFTKEIMEEFYESMEYVFRDAFGSVSKTGEAIVNGISGLLFGN